MASAEDPLRLHSNYSSTSCTSQTIDHRPPGRNHDRPTTPSYRLFPTVEPTTPRTPTSVVTLQEKSSRRPVERSGRRSSSLDNLARIAAPRRNVPVLKLATNTGRRDSKNNVRPMSVAHDSIVDSPTVPGWLGDLPRSSDENAHGRSSSAPGEFIRDSQTLPARVVQTRDARSRLGLKSRQPDAPANKGLGLPLTQSNPTAKVPARKGLASRRPDLTIAIKKDDEPPPPPPKSPRHSQTSSAQSPVSPVSGSPVSSFHDSPTDGVVATPGSIMRAALVDAQGSPARTPPTLNATKASYFPPAGAVRVRQLTGSRDLDRQTPSQAPVPAPSTDKPVAAKPSKPNVDKPMPSLPASSRFSDHIREVRAAEGAERDKTPIADTSEPDERATAPTEGAPTTQTASLDQRRDHGELPSAPKKESLKVVNQDIPRFARAPAPEAENPPQPRSNPSQTTIVAGKATALAAPKPPSRSASPEPRSMAKTAESNTASSDPLQNLENLSKQTETLHARYATLRADRLKLSTSISASLKDHKPSPEYANSLLDKHLEINAINSSIDICFAKLKSLDCRKEEAIALLIAQTKAGKSMTGHARKPSSTDSHATNPSLADSAIYTPDSAATEPKSLTPELRGGAGFTPAPRAAENAPKTSSETIKELRPSPRIPDQPPPDPPETGTSPSPSVSEDARSTPKSEKSEGEVSPGTERRQTAIRVSPLPTPVPNLPAEPDQLSPVSPVSPISSFEEKPKRIRVKGVKAAKILGLVAQSANGSQTDGQGITLPDEPLLRNVAPATKPATVEVEIHRKPVPKKKSPHIAAMMSPTRAGPPPPRKGTNDSMTSLTSSSQAESSPEQSEARTPPGSPKVPPGQRGTKKGAGVKTIQVVVDDDILDYYKGSGW